MHSKQFQHALLMLAVVVSALIVRAPSVVAQETNTPNQISAELIGQVLNASPKVSAQYGYVSYVSGLDTDAITAPDSTLSEQSALLTFYNDTATERVINNGPMRVIDRSGEATFYLNTTPAGNFGDPKSFQQGVAVLKATLRHQVIVNTLTNAFTAHFDCIVTSNEPFSLNDGRYRLGQPGQHFEITFSGHLNPKAPPSGYMAGFVTGLELQSTGK